MTNTASLAAIAAGIDQVMANSATPGTPARELWPLLIATESRAVGCWRHIAEELHLAGFLAVEAMPAVVQTEFVEATRRVALSQTHFGIVQAVLGRGPAINHRAAAAGGPVDGSVGWLGRFEAASSLAIPIERDGQLAGALAVATRHRIEPGDAVWRLVVDAANLWSGAAR